MVCDHAEMLCRSAAARNTGVVKMLSQNSFGTKKKNQRVFFLHSGCTSFAATARVPSSSSWDTLGEQVTPQGLVLFRVDIGCC